MDITIDHIKKVVSDFYGFDGDEIDKKCRKREIVQARQIAMYFSKSLTKSSLASIGSQIGSKDHATVLHACKTVNNLIDTDKFIREDVDSISIQLAGINAHITSKDYIKELKEFKSKWLAKYKSNEKER